METKRNMGLIGRKKRRKPMTKGRVIKKEAYHLAYIARKQIALKSITSIGKCCVQSLSLARPCKEGLQESWC